MNTDGYKLPIILWSWGGRFPDSMIDKIKSMIGRHLHMPHRFVVISDSKATRENFHKKGDQVVPLWPDNLRVGGKCFVRLKAFHPSMADLIGPRFAWIDLDMVVTDDITPIFSREEDFIISGVELRPQPYNGSIVMMNAGSRRQVFDNFSVNKWRAERPKLRYGGSDQAWIAIELGPDEATWTRRDGLFCYRDDIAPRNSWGYEARIRRGCLPLEDPTTNGPMPEGCRLIQCNGPWNPDSPKVLSYSPWIANHYR